MPIADPGGGLPGTAPRRVGTGGDGGTSAGSIHRVARRRLQQALPGPQTGQGEAYTPVKPPAGGPAHLAPLTMLYLVAKRTVCIVEAVAEIVMGYILK